MAVKTILKIAGLFILLLIGIPLTATLYHSYRFSDSDCGKLIALAQDGERARYLEDWATAAIRRQSLLAYLGPGTTGNAQDDPDFFRTLDIDWALLGIDRNAASIALVRKPGNPAQDADPDAVTALVIGSGPERIAVRVNGAADLPPDDAGETPAGYFQFFTSADQRIAVYCESHTP